ncbi:MAG: T9SS type A sorting domain-containing protein, partial [Salegentibacter sp.]
YKVTVSAEGTDNYLPASKEVSLVIENAEIEGVAFEGATFTYDGTEDSIFVTGLPEGATVKYENNGHINAGTYTVTATVSQDNHINEVLTANLVINKAAQSIAFDELEDRNLETDDNFLLNATSTSGLAVAYSYTSEDAEPAATVSLHGLVRLLASGQINITATQQGNQNYEAATPVTRTLHIVSSDARLNNVVIDGTSYSNPSTEVFYLIACGSDEDQVEIELEPNRGSSVDHAELFTIATPAPGIYKETVTVTSEDGSTNRTYNIKVEKPFSFDDIVVQKFNNVLLVNNNPETNGGYKFTSYKWYKNGFLVGTNQYFSEGDNASDQLDSESSYYVEMITEEGEVLRTCSTAVQLRSSYQVILARNPVSSGEQLELFADFPQEELETMQLSIYDLNGVQLKRMRSNRKTTPIELPFNIQSGVYILNCQTNAHSKSLKFIVR